MEKNVTLSLCTALVVALVVPVMAVAQEPGDTVHAEDLSWLPAVGEDGVIRWGAARERTQPDTERRAAPNIFQVVAVEHRGSFIVLEDGSRWEVYLPHRTGTVTWRAGDHVLIQPAPVRRGGHAWRMQNGERDHVAIVRFAGAMPGDPAPAGAPASPEP